jgi:hypothetical protein
MAMDRRILAVVGAVLMVAAVGGLCLLKASAIGPSTAADRAQVTGFATSNILGQTTGSVSVELHGASAARINQIVQGLPPANPEYICAENPQEYQISFTADTRAGARQGFGLTGYGCGNLVVEVPSHGLPTDRIDRDCALLKAVRRLLPASAIATHSGPCAAASAELYLAASRRHQTPTDRTLTDRTLTGRTPTGRTPTGRRLTGRRLTGRTLTGRTPTDRTVRRVATRRVAARPWTVRQWTPGRGTRRPGALRAWTSKLE